MKSATGEANLTVITIILIAVMVPIIMFVVRRLMVTSAKKSCCNGAGGIWENSTCARPKGKDAKGYDVGEYQNCIDKVLGSGK